MRGGRLKTVGFICDDKGRHRAWKDCQSDPVEGMQDTNGNTSFPRAFCLLPRLLVP